MADRGRQRVVLVGLLVAGFAVVPTAASPAVAAGDPDCDRRPTGVATHDYYLAFEVPVGLMPDPLFDGRAAQLRVHAVEPVYANGQCPDVERRAAVLVHGRSVPGSAAFDLRLASDEEGDAVSLQVALARAGVHTYAPDLIGYGRSTRFADGLDSPCNASLGPDVDRTRNAAVFPLNQQTRYAGDGLSPPADGLGVNPLGGETCAHLSSRYFANPDVFARDVRQVIDDVIERTEPAGGKVGLLGYSFGGPTVARTLYLLGASAAGEVSRVVFVNSLFNRVPGVPVEVNLPTEESGLSEAERSTSFPLTLSSAGWPGVGSGARDAECSGRVPPGAPAQLRADILALDPLGASWGGSDPAHPTGLVRSPTFTLYGWNRDVAATIHLPTLVLHGLDDMTSPVQNSTNIFDALTGTGNKVLVQVACGSHQLLNEGCAGRRCNDRLAATKPYGQTSASWDGPSATVAAAVAEWLEHGTFAGTPCGRFEVDVSGIARPVPTQACNQA